MLDESTASKSYSNLEKLAGCVVRKE